MLIQTVRCCFVLLQAIPYAQSIESAVMLKKPSKSAIMGIAATVMSTTGNPTACGGNITLAVSNQIIIQTPNYPNNYASNMNCVWYINTNSGYRVDLAFDVFELTTRDSLEIFGGNTTDAANRLTTLTGNNSYGVLSSSNQMTIKFVSGNTHGTYQLQRFKARLSASSVPTTGPYAYSTPNGLLMSPGFPANYQNSETAEYQILVTGLRIFITISQLQMEQGYDFLKIYNSFRLGEDLLQSLSGTIYQPVRYASTGNGMSLRFTSDGSNTGKGFLATYTSDPLSCGGSIYLQPSSPSRSITSPDYPNNYPNSANCMWFIRANSGYRINLHFNSFNTESGYDFVKVYGGNTTATDLQLASFAGTTFSNVLSSSNQMTITFTSDGSNTETGFQASLSVSTLSITGPYRYTDSNGVLMSPNYPNNYGDSESVYYYITVLSHQVVQLTITQFETETNDDFLYIYDGSSASSNLIRRLSGRFQSTPITSLSYQMTLRFTSDSSTNYKGFLATYAAITHGSTNCGTSIVLSSLRAFHHHSISSPNYPSNYPPNQDCIWQITTSSSSYRPKISFNTFYTEKNYDYVKVYATESLYSTSNTLVAKFSGSSTPYSITSGSRYMVVEFYSDGNTQYTGFIATLSIDSSIQMPSANIYRTADNGYIMSPFFPNNYGNNEDIRWYITVSSGNSVQVTMNYLYTESGDDILYFYEGSSVSSSDIITRISGNHPYEYSEYPTSCSNQMTIRFVTDGSGVRGGFVGTYTAVDSYEYSIQCYNYNYNPISGGTIAAIVIGIFSFFGLITVVVVVVRQRRRGHVHNPQPVVTGFPAQQTQPGAVYYNRGFVPNQQYQPGVYQNGPEPMYQQPGFTPVPALAQGQMPVPSYEQAANLPQYALVNQLEPPSSGASQTEPQKQ